MLHVYLAMCLMPPEVELFSIHAKADANDHIVFLECTHEQGREHKAATSRGYNTIIYEPHNNVNLASKYTTYMLMVVAMLQAIWAMCIK